MLWQLPSLKEDSAPLRCRLNERKSVSLVLLFYFLVGPPPLRVSVPVTQNRKSNVFFSLCSGTGVPGASKRARQAHAERPLFVKAPAPRPTSSSSSCTPKACPIPWGAPRAPTPAASLSQNPWVRNPTRLAPVVNYKVRGVAPVTSLATDDRERLLRELDADILAPSTAAARASNFRTWATFHMRWFGTALPILPVTADSLRAVAAQMKSAGYRSFANYVVAAKAAHVKNFPWCATLDECRRQCVASTQRGIGPARQTLEIPIRDLAGLDLGCDPLVEDGPVCPGSWAVLSAFHMTRGAESACALASSLRVDVRTQTESWWLPVSKMDPQAAGCVRSWGCVCGSGSPCGSFFLCPHRAAVSHLARLRVLFGKSDSSLPSDLPLFPNSRGSWCSKAGFVGTVRALALRLNIDTIDELGRCAVGEHVWRVSGSRYLASLDVPVPIIRLLARWGSDAILRYIADAPLSALTRVYLERIQADESSARAVRTDASEGVTARHLLAVNGNEIPSTDPVCADAVAARGAALPFLRSHRTGRVHLIVPPPFVGLRDATQTICGWQLVGAAADRVPLVPAGADRCSRCGPIALWLSACDVAAFVSHASDSD